MHPLYDPSWELQSCALPGLFQSSNHFSKPPPLVLVCESGQCGGHSVRSEKFIFETLVTFGRHTHAPPLKPPLAPSQAARRPVMFHPSSPWASILIHGDLSSRISARAFCNLDCHTSPLAQDAKKSRETNVPTRISRLCWQFGEIRAQEPFVPPKMNL